MKADKITIDCTKDLDYTFKQINEASEMLKEPKKPSLWQKFIVWLKCLIDRVRR